MSDFSVHLRALRLFKCATAVFNENIKLLFIKTESFLLKVFFRIFFFFLSIKVVFQDFFLNNNDMSFLNNLEIKRVDVYFLFWFLLLH